MKVILLADLKNVGHKSDVKEVEDGYAKNFLIPRGLARAATPEALKNLEKTNTALEKEDRELVKHLTALREIMNERSIVFPVKVNEEGKIFGSITKEMILKALRDNKLIGKERVEITLDHPLKELGEYEIAVNLKKGITANIKVILKTEE